MAQDAFTLYKLIILYMLERAKLPLTNAQISDFILENDYTNYFNIQSIPLSFNLLEITNLS